MGNEFQDMSTTPTLTLDPFQAQEQKKPPVVQQEEPARSRSRSTLQIPRWCSSTGRERRRRWRISQSLPSRMSGQRTWEK